jgi:hypothetical protein
VHGVSEEVCDEYGEVRIQRVGENGWGAHDMDTTAETNLNGTTPDVLSQVSGDGIRDATRLAALRQAASLLALEKRLYKPKASACRRSMARIRRRHRTRQAGW